MLRNFFKNNKYFIFIFITIGIFVGGFMLSSKGRISLTASAVNYQLDDQTATIMSIKKIIPAVVSIIIYDQQNVINADLVTGSQSVSKVRQEVGAGTGFLISPDGLILTNKHIVDAVTDNTVSYRIILNSGKQYYAQVIGTDPVYDLAIIKIFDKDLPYVSFGDSDKLQLGTTVVAIGNALGQYQNSVTKGIVSGLGRSITAGDGMGNSESLDNVIQTDAEINLGNSGGPLIDLNGQVVGIDTATDEAGSAIGFAIPINDAMPIIKSVETDGTIIRPKLGIQYQMLTPEIAQDNKLSLNYGAWVVKGDDGSPAVVVGSAADKAGIEEGDIITEINGIKLDGNRSLLSVIQKFKPGQTIKLKIERGDKILILSATLDKF